MTSLIERTRELWDRDDLPEELRWIDQLSPRHQRLFFGEVQFEWSRYCATGDSTNLLALYEDWSATADVDANNEHAGFLLSDKSKDDYEEWKAVS